MGNGEAKELICMTQGRGRGMLGEGGAGQREIKGRKKWDNCNSIISKMYILQKEQVSMR